MLNFVKKHLFVLTEIVELNFPAAIDNFASPVSAFVMLNTCEITSTQLTRNFFKTWIYIIFRLRLRLSRPLFVFVSTLDHITFTN